MLNDLPATVAQRQLKSCQGPAEIAALRNNPGEIGT
jgi:hypothetical protein